MGIPDSGGSEVAGLRGLRRPRGEGGGARTPLLSSQDASRLRARSEARPLGGSKLQGGAQRKRGQRAQGGAGGASLGDYRGRGVRSAAPKGETFAVAGCGPKAGTAGKVRRRWAGPPARRLSKSPEISTKGWERQGRQGTARPCTPGAHVTVIHQAPPLSLGQKEEGEGSGGVGGWGKEGEWLGRGKGGRREEEERED